MASLLPDVKLLFWSLRNPIERLYSSYNFHVGRLNIPETMSFEEYVDKSLAYDNGATDAIELGIDEWCLKTMRIGRYVEFLMPFFDAFPRCNIRVMFFEQLENDVRQLRSIQRSGIATHSREKTSRSQSATKVCIDWRCL